MKTEWKQAPVTMTLIAIMAVVFLAMQVLRFGEATSSQTVFDFGGLLGLYVRQYPLAIWRLLTPIFVHIGWQHFLFNAAAIYIVGRLAERIWGSLTFLGLYLLSGLLGNAFVFYFTPDVVTAGASSSIFGVFAAVALLGYAGKNPYLKQMGQSYAAIIVVNLIFNLITPEVSLIGHVGGLVGGLLCAIFLPVSAGVNPFQKWQRILAALAYLLFIIGLIWLGFH